MPCREERIEALFQAALELDPGARRRFLSAACGGDADLGHEVERLLELDSLPDGRLDSPVPARLAYVSPSADLLVGRQLGPYHLTRCLAAGGMGTVYAARQEHPEREVALKVLRTDAATPDTEQRFRDEASFLGRLQHPGIAHVYGADVVVLDGLRVPYIAMELVEGARTITEHARAEGLTLAQRVELFAKVCDAVHSGHQKGVLHRDLKPGNVLVDRSGRPKLIDYGVARALDRSARRTEAGVFLGTIQYVSPEQCADAHDSDVRSDVYSLGVLLYELLCGRLPFELGNEPLPQAARILQERPPRRPSTLARAVRGDVETILLKALEKEREHRYQSAAELGADLRRYLGLEPIAARAPGWIRRSVLFVRRRKALVSAASAVFLATIAGTVVSLRFALREQAAREREELQAMLANLAAADASLRVHDAPSARQRLERVSAEHRGWEWRHLASRLDLSDVAWSGPSRYCEGLRWRGGLLATGWSSDDGGRVLVWSAESGEELARSPLLSADEPTALEWLEDGSLAWGGKDGRLVRWLPGGSSPAPLRGSHDQSVTALCGDGRGGIVSASADGSVRRWSLAASAEESTLVRGGVAWSDMALDPRGQRIALAGADGSVRVVPLSAPEDEIVLAGHARPVLSVAFDPEGLRLAAGARDGTILVWELSPPRIVQRLLGHESEVRALAYLTDGARLLSASFDGTLRCWDVATGRALTVLHGHEGWISRLAISPDGLRCATGGYDQTVRLWDLARATDGTTLRAHSAAVRDLAFAPDGSCLATASFDGTAKLLDASTWTEVLTLGGHGGRVMSIAFHPGDALLATAANDHRVRLWDSGSGRLLGVVEGAEDGVHCVAFSRRGDLLAYGAKDGLARILAFPGLRPVAELSHEDWVNGLVFTHDDARLVTATRGGRIQSWDLRSGRERWKHTSPAAWDDVALSPDGALLAAASADGTVRLLDADSGVERATLRGHRLVVRAVAFSPDGRRLASAAEDGTVRLWDVRAGTEVLTLRGHESWVQAVAFSPDGTVLASGGGNYDGTGIEIRIWEAE